MYFEAQRLAREYLDFPTMKPNCLADTSQAAGIASVLTRSCQKQVLLLFIALWMIPLGRLGVVPSGDVCGTPFRIRQLPRPPTPRTQCINGRLPQSLPERATHDSDEKAKLGKIF